MKPLALAVLCAVLAGPALAQTKFDFTVRPKLFPHPTRQARDAGKRMTVEEAKALKEDLFASYQNIGALSRFRFHKRTKDEAPMTSDELGWAETELKDEMALAEKLAPEAGTALKTGIDRPEPYPKDFKNPLKNMRFSVRGVSMMRTTKPTYEEYRMSEQNAMSAVMLNLHALVEAASDREGDPKEDAEYVAQAKKELSDEYAALASARKGMLDAVKEAERAVGPKGGTTGKGMDKLRLGFDDRSSAAGRDTAAGVSGEGGKITAEEAARRANEAERAAMNRKKGRGPAVVPPP